MLCPESLCVHHSVPSLCWGLGGCACILGVALGILLGSRVLGILLGSRVCARRAALFFHVRHAANQGIGSISACSAKRACVLCR